MVRKLLTAIDEFVARHECTARLIMGELTSKGETQLLMQIQARSVQQASALKFVNVQRLLAMHRGYMAGRLLPYITPPEVLTLMQRAQTPLLEEEEYVYKGTLPMNIIERERYIRRQETRTEQRLAEVRKTLLHPTAINLIDHTAFCMLEKYLWTTLQTETKQILEQLLYMTISKSYWLEPITGLEALQRLMLQMYITAFMEMPQTLNLVSLRLTALTRQYLYGMNAQMYMTLCAQAQALKTKALLIPCQLRKFITKGIAIGKKRKEYVPTKQEIGTTEELGDETEVSVGKDLFNKDMFFTMLRYAYGMPYWLRRFWARQLGMPENHKYARYFGIGCVPIRRSLWGYKRKRYSPESWATFSRDEYVKWAKKYGIRYRTGYPF